MGNVLPSALVNLLEKTLNLGKVVIIKIINWIRSWVNSLSSCPGVNPCYNRNWQIFSPPGSSGRLSKSEPHFYRSHRKASWIFSAAGAEEPGFWKHTRPKLRVFENCCCLIYRVHFRCHPYLPEDHRNPPSLATGGGRHGNRHGHHKRTCGADGRRDSCKQHPKQRHPGKSWSEIIQIKPMNSW